MNVEGRELEEKDIEQFLIDKNTRIELYIESINNALTKKAFVCSVHSKHMEIFCFNCRASFCSECIINDHNLHYSVEKSNLNLDTIKNQSSNLISFKGEGEKHQLNMIIAKIDKEFESLQEMIEKAKNECIKEVELYYYNLQVLKQKLNSEVDKGIRNLENFCETYIPILTKESITLNDGAFIQLYEIQYLAKLSTIEVQELLLEKDQEFSKFLESASQTTNRFKDVIPDLLNFTQVQKEKSSHFLLNFEPQKSDSENLEKKTTNEENYTRNRGVIDTKDHISSMRVENKTTLEDFNNYLKKNSTFLDNFSKEIKSMKNANTFHNKNSFSKKPEIDLVNKVDSRLFLKAFLKFIQSNGDDLENMITLQSMLSFSQNRNESNRSLSSNKTKTKYTKPVANSKYRQTSTLVKTTGKPIPSYHKKNITLNMNRLYDSNEFEGMLSGRNTNNQNKNRSVASNYRTAGCKLEKRIISDKQKSKAIPSPFKVKDELVNSKKTKSKSSLRATNIKNDTSSKRDQIRTGEAEFTDDSENNVESPKARAKMRNRLSDQLIKILITSNIKIRTDPIKLINQYLANNYNLTKITDHTIKSLIDQIFNHDYAKPVEGKTEINIYDFKNCRIVKKHTNLNKTLHGCISFLNGLRYTIVNEILYIIGGRDWSQEYNIALKYDISKETLTRVADMNYSRAYCSLVSSDDDKFIYAIGGAENRSCEFYDIGVGGWNRLPSLNFERGNCSLYLYKDMYLYVFSGFKGDIRLNVYEENIERLYLPNAVIWETIQYKNSAFIDMRFANSGVIPLTAGNILIYGGENSRYNKKCQVVYDLFRNEIFNADEKMDEIRKELLLEYQTNNSKNI